MEYKMDYIPKSRHRRPGTKIIATSITIHSTANEKSTAKNERDNLARESNTRAASFHIVVDDKEVIECIPLNEITYHAGNREGNNTSISIEMCESGDRVKTLQNTVELVAKMLHERGWGTDKLKRHFDWSGKNCPRIINYNNWEGWRGFVISVERELDKLKAGEKSKVNHEPSNWAKDDWNWGIKNKITDGSNPKGMATREEVVTMIRRSKEVK